jgi:amidase
MVAMLVLMGPTAVASPPVSSAHPGFELDGATIPELARLMSTGELTAERLTSAYLERIGTVDKAVHAVLTVDPTALDQARTSDRRRAEGRSLGLLDGIPVLLKDNIDTASMPTTAGSRALAGQPPAEDAELVKRLRAAGAVILGKTNLSEWANFRSTGSTSGWSGTGDQTNNPYVLDRNPCGSSSGSGAAVAAALAQVAIGTETDGSIVCPAGANGVVGHKPSLGLVSGAGVVPISAEQDTAGPMGRHVIDVAITLAALRGESMSAVDFATLRGARVGLWRKAGINPDVDRVMEDTAAVLRAHGATVVEVDLPYQDEIDENEFPALVSEFRRDLEHYLKARPGGPDTIAELIEFNRRDPVELSRFGQEIFEQAVTAPPTDDPEYQRQRATATSLARASIDETLAAHELDVIVAPTNGPAWRTSYGEGDDFELGSSTPAAVAGYPNLTVPAGFAGELPLGASFMAGRFDDARVLAFGAAFERATHVRKPPRYLPTAGG